MPDIAKKIRKKCSAQLDVGESVLAGVVVQPPGSMAKQMGAGIGGLAGAAIAGKMASKHQVISEGERSAGVAATIPAKKCVVGVTERRLLVFGMNIWTGAPKGLLSAVPLTEVADVTADHGKVASKVVVRFRDGSAVGFEVARTVKPVEFVDTLARHRTP